MSWKKIIAALARRKSSRRTPRTRMIEKLEDRHLMAADFRAIDGVGNNLLNPDWGSTDENFLRTVAAEYADGVSSPGGADRVSARVISNLLADHGAEDLPNDRDMSAFVWAWGQFLDHDIDLTLSTTDPAEAFPIEVPTGDAYFDPTGTGTQTIGLTRSQFDPSTGTGVDNVREQVNSITAFVDGSQIYGSDAETAASLRTFSGGRLLTSEGDFLPIDENGNFYSGDIRVNENPGLTSLHTLFVREHNRLADQFAAEHPQWTDERVYQESRRIVIAEMQAITYQEFLPALLGRDALSPYQGYDETVNPGISNEFAAAAYRFGHSLLDSEISFMDNDGAEVHEALPLRDAFFNTSVLLDTDIGAVFKYLASDLSEEVDVKVIDDLRNFLFGPPGSGGLDLASLNIQRGRDHGLADYNAVRVAYGLPAVVD
ncbi:MAG: peroxidase family protein, partial [Planctomycetales bacterium]|nr:peroxidase family protein [Planctomycetales bacterium]